MATPPDERERGSVFTGARSATLLVLHPHNPGEQISMLHMQIRELGPREVSRLLNALKGKMRRVRSV